MDIVSDLPFTLKLIQKYPVETIQEARVFCKEEQDIWKNNIITLSVEENEEMDLYFNADDPEARLYMETLSMIPADDLYIKKDRHGRIFRAVSPEHFALYRSGRGYDALRVDTFRIAVLCQNEWYYGTLQILPKPIAIEEWQMMRDDIEHEIRDLSQEIVRHSIGIGNNHENIPPKVIHNFLVMRKYSNKVMMALTDISSNPRSEIITVYENVSRNEGENYSFDAETVRRFAVRSGSEPTYKIPVKTVNYDIQENRILKRILLDYEKKLEQFIKLIDEMDVASQSKISWKNNLEEFKGRAVRLHKMTAILKSQKWYALIQDLRDPYIPHGLILDSRYSLLYQMHLDLKRDDIDLGLNTEFSYTWKSSSYMYEIWCYLKICRIFMSEYIFVPDGENDTVDDRTLFPLLDVGKTIHFKKSDLRLEVIYDMCLPLKQEDTSLKQPLYMARHHSDYRNHNRPDLVVHIYDTQEQWYLGSIIIECKYRKLNSFWTENSSRSSRGQLEAYYNNARSRILYGGIGELFNIRPVTKVIVLTPDDFGDGQEQTDFGVLVKSFKASDDDKMVNELKTVLLSEIARMRDRYELAKRLRKSL
ncbi:hypothetical protein IMSAGC011_01827 [Lachnospiraceae bacterium]|nr:hypothetical protein IMSAGC011_01827 [Lachnospiraceae bacterium]